MNTREMLGGALIPSRVPVLHQWRSAPCTRQVGPVRASPNPLAMTSGRTKRVKLDGPHNTTALPRARPAWNHAVGSSFIVPGECPAAHKRLILSYQQLLLCACSQRYLEFLEFKKACLMDDYACTMSISRRQPGRSHQCTTEK